MFGQSFNAGVLVQRCDAPSVNTPTKNSSTTSSLNISFTGNADGCPITEAAIGIGPHSNNITYHVVSGDFGSGDFTVNKNFTGLSENTTYSFRAKATNSAGTTISSAVNFTTDYNYATISLGLYSNYQPAEGNSNAYFNKSYYQLVNGSYYNSSTLNSAYNFAITGINGGASMIYSGNRPSKQITGWTSHGSCTGGGSAIIINANSGGSYPVNTGITFSSLTTHQSTDCRSGNSGSWTLQSSNRVLHLGAHKEQGHEFEARFNVS